MPFASVLMGLDVVEITGTMTDYTMPPLFFEGGKSFEEEFDPFHVFY